MKKIIALFIVALLATVSQAVVIDTFVNGDFDSGAVSNPFDGFDAPSSPEIIGWTNYPAGALNDSGVEGTGGWWNGGGSNAAFMSTNDAAYNLSSYVIQAGDTFSVSFVGKGWGGSAQWTVSFFYDNPANVVGSFTVVPGNWNWIALSSPTPIMATAPSVGGTLGILFKSTGTNVACLDEMIIDVVALPVANDSPANGATLISPVRTDADNDLVFTIYDADITKADVQFGTEGDPNLTTKPAYKIVDDMAVTQGQYTVNLQSLAADLQYNTTYYWKVVGYEPNALAVGGFDAVPGPVWNFKTVGQTAVAGAVAPALTAVDAGTTAVLNLTGTANATIFQWFKDGVALSDGADFSGTATASLTINDVQLADEGSYYCRVDNNLPGTSPVNSVAGLVMTNRLIIHYPLEVIVDVNSTPDIVGGYKMTLMSDDGGIDVPSLVAGVPQLGGNCLLFDNRGAADPNFWGQYATAGDVDMEAMGKGLTIAFWAQWVDDNTNWQGIINRRGTWSAANMMWRIDKNPSTGEISFEREGGAGRVAATLVKGSWNHITATFDAVSGATKMFNNGELVATGTGFTFGTGVNSGFKLGANNDDGSDFFYGKIDDVKVYNYARNTVQVAQDYANVMGGYVCDKEGTDTLLYDINKDCQVDIGDLLLFAADWLNSNRILPQ